MSVKLGKFLIQLKKKKRNSETSFTTPLHDSRAYIFIQKIVNFSKSDEEETKKS